MNQRIPWKKLISHVVLLTFLANGVVTANGVPQAVIAGNTRTIAPTTLHLPSHIGTVVDHFQGTGKKQVIVIQDLHCDPLVQKNISAIIRQIKKTYGTRCTALGIEGTATGAIDTRILSGIPDSAIRNTVANYFVEHGDISGGELYAIEHGDIQPFGIENEHLYNANFDALAQSLAYRNDVERVLGRIKRGLGKAKQYVYTPDALTIERTRNEYALGKLSTENYLTFLMNRAQQYGIPVEQTFPQLTLLRTSFALHKKLNASMVNAEALFLVAQLQRYCTPQEHNTLAQYKTTDNDAYYAYLNEIVKAKRVRIATQFTHLQNYFAYLDCTHAMDNTKVVSEQSALEYAVLCKALLGSRRLQPASFSSGTKTQPKGCGYQTMVDASDRSDGCEVAYCERYVNLMESYLANRVSPSDVTEWNRERNNVYTRMDDLGERVLVENYFKNNEGLFKANDEVMDNFYNYAARRNQVMVNNIMSMADKAGSDVSVVVVGGYHRQGITAVLRSQNISYQVIMPQMSGTYNPNVYMRRVQKQIALERSGSRRLQPACSSATTKTQPKGCGYHLQESASALMVATQLQNGTLVPATIQRLLDVVAEAYQGDVPRIQEFFTRYEESSGINVTITPQPDGTLHCTAVFTQNGEKITTQAFATQGTKTKHAVAALLSVKGTFTFKTICGVSNHIGDAIGAQLRDPALPAALLGETDTRAAFRAICGLTFGSLAEVVAFLAHLHTRAYDQLTDQEQAIVTMFTHAGAEIGYHLDVRIIDDTDHHVSDVCAIVSDVHADGSATIYIPRAMMDILTTLPPAVLVQFVRHEQEEMGLGGEGAHEQVLRDELRAHPDDTAVLDFISIAPIIHQLSSPNLSLDEITDENLQNILVRYRRAAPNGNISIAFQNMFQNIAKKLTSTIPSLAAIILAEIAQNPNGGTEQAANILALIAKTPEGTVQAATILARIAQTSAYGGIEQAAAIFLVITKTYDRNGNPTPDGTIRAAAILLVTAQTPDDGGTEQAAAILARIAQIPEDEDIEVAAAILAWITQFSIAGQVQAVAIFTWIPIQVAAAILSRIAQIPNGGTPRAASILFQIAQNPAYGGPEQVTSILARIAQTSAYGGTPRAAEILAWMVQTSAYGSTPRAAEILSQIAQNPAFGGPELYTAS